MSLQPPVSYGRRGIVGAVEVSLLTWRIGVSDKHEIANLNLRCHYHLRDRYGRRAFCRVVYERVRAAAIAHRRSPIHADKARKRSGRRYPADISEGGARIASVPDLNLQDPCTLHIEGIAASIAFIVREKTEHQTLLELAAEGETRQQYLAWLHRQMSGLVAA